MEKGNLGITIKSVIIISVIAIGIAVFMNMFMLVSSNHVEVTSESPKKTVEQQTTVPDGYIGIYNASDLQNMSSDLSRKLYIDGRY